MISTGIAFLVGFMFTIPAIVVSFIFTLYFERYERHWAAVFFEIVLLFCVSNYFDVGWGSFALSMLAFIPIGFVWSFFRWKKHCSTVVKKFEEKVKESMSAQSSWYVRENVDPSNNVGLIVAWIILWPVSMIEQLASSMLDLLERSVLRIADLTYKKFSEEANKRIDEIEKNRDER
jgi:hypothetical protein